MKRLTSILILTLLCLATVNNSRLQAQSYESMWKNIEKAESDDLPRELVKESEKLIKAAQRKGDFAWEMAGWVVKVNALRGISPDSMRTLTPPDYRHSPVNDAVADALVGQGMADSRILERVLQNKEALFAANEDNFQPLLTIGSDSRLFNHDMLNVMTSFIMQYQGLNAEGMAKVYGEVADFYKAKGKRDAYTLMRLKQLYNLNRSSNSKYYLRGDDYRARLKELIEESKDIETGADVAEKYLDELYDDKKLEFARWAEKQFKANGAFKNAINDLTHPNCSFYFNNKYIDGTPLHYTINYRNASKIHFEVRLYNGEDKNDRLRTDGKLILERDYNGGRDFDESVHSIKEITGEVKDSISLQPNRYVFIAKAAGEQSVNHFDLTNLSLFVMDLHDSQLLCRVLDMRTGMPVEGATVIGIEKKAEKYKALTNKNGEVIISPDKTEEYAHSISVYAYLTPSNRTATLSTYNYRGNSNDSHKKEDVYYQSFLDRPIYRPGQTVNIAVLAYSQKGDETRALANSNVKVVLRDVNYKEVESKVVTTSSLGSANCSFRIPENIKTGQWRIEVNGSSSHYFRVEEYKRPAFYVEVLNRKSQATDGTPTEPLQYSIGDSVPVRVRAKTYSGVPVQNAKVKYKIETCESSYRYFMFNNWTSLRTGELLTDKNGEALVELFLDSMRYNVDRDNVVRFKVHFDVTDQAGETEEDNYYISISSRGFGLTIQCGDIVDLSEKDAITVTASNAEGNKVNASGEYELRKGKEVITKGTFETGKPIALSQTLTPGDYTIEVFANDKNGHKIDTYRNIKIFASQHPMVRTEFSSRFFYQKNSTIDENTPGRVYFSPLTERTPLYMVITAYDKVVEKREIIADRKLNCIEFPYKKIYGDGINVRLYGVRNGDELNKSMNFTYRRPDKNLELTWKTFRDKLVPGEETEWTLTVSDLNGRPVSGAEMFATLYDASLNKFTTDNWYFSTAFSRFIPRYEGRCTKAITPYSMYLTKSAKNAKTISRNFTTLTQIIDSWGYRRRSRYDNAMLGAGMVESRPMAMAKESAPRSRAVLEEVALEDAAPESKSATAKQAPQETRKIRSDFSETAVFLPSVISGSNGDLKISFRLPESLTQWQFMGLVHTADVRHGTILATAVAQQPFMVQPNMPRFLREGDKATLSTRIFNNSDKDMKVTLRCEIKEENSNTIHSKLNTQNSSLKKGESQTLDLAFPDLPAGNYIVEVFGESGKTSDGERHRLVVLPADTVRSATGTLPAISDPKGMVYDALETMKLPDYENSPSLAASIYSNMMLKKYKNISNTDSLIQAATDKLLGLQLRGGAWTWFKGMEGSRYITVAVCEQLALLLNNYSAEQIQADELLKKLSLSLSQGMNFVDTREIEMFREWKKLTKAKDSEYRADDTSLHYLRVYTLLPQRTMSKELAKIRDLYLGNLEKSSRSLSIYGKSNGSLLLNYFGHKKSAGTFLQSMYEYSVYKKGMGRYFDTRKANYSWMDYRIPTQLAAMNAIRLTKTEDLAKTHPLSTLDSRLSTLKEMTLWVLRQKQVQKWDNPINTVEAASYILAEDDDLMGKMFNDLTAGADSLGDFDALDDQLVVTMTPSADSLKVGDKVKIMVHVRNEIDMDFVRIRINHAACMEPVSQLSGYRYVGNQYGYVARHDSNTEVFYDTFRKGDHDIALEFYVTSPGRYAIGSTEVKCMYCTDFTATAESKNISVVK